MTVFVLQLVSPLVLLILSDAGSSSSFSRIQQAPALADLKDHSYNNQMCRPRGYLYFRRPEGGGDLAPKFASEILVGALNFASKIIGDKYPKFCPLNFRYDPKIGIFSQLLRLAVAELPKFFVLFGELGPNFASKLDVRSKPPPPRPPDMEVAPLGV